MSSPRTTVVIVTHNTRNDALACIASLEGAGESDIIVVDSGSTDDTVEHITQRFPAVTILSLPNVGFGQAATRGVMLAKTDYVVISNADTLYTPDVLDMLTGYLVDHPDVGIVGPGVVFGDGRVQHSARSFPGIGTAMGHGALSLFWANNPWSRAYKHLDWDRRGPKDVDWVSGCCFGARTAAFVDIGGFDPAYFMFVEDVDLCWRMHEQGWRVVCLPQATVVHNVGSSVQGRKRQMVIEHAKSLDIFIGRHYRPGVLGRSFLRLGLLGWVATVIGWTAIKGGTHGQAQG